MSVCIIIITTVLLSYPVEAHSEDRLVMTHAIFRHGDRAPVDDMTSDEARMFYYRGKGHLTDAGFRQAEELGVALRRRLVDTDFLDDRLLPNEFVFRSSQAERCLQTASAVGASMFRRDENQPVYIPVISDNKQNDFLCFPHNCEKVLVKLREEFGAPLNATFWSLVKMQMKEATMNSTYFNTRERVKMLEPLLLERPAGLAVPAWFNPSAEDEAIDIMSQSLSFASSTGAFHNAEYISARTGYLLHTILNDITYASLCVSAQKTNCQYRKFYAYATHDIHLMSLMESFSLLEPSVLGAGRILPFTACLLIELWEIQGQPMVELLYRGQEGQFVPVTSLFPPCAGRDVCPAKELTSCCQQYRTAQPVCKHSVVSAASSSFTIGMMSCLAFCSFYSSRFF